MNQVDQLIGPLLKAALLGTERNQISFQNEDGKLGQIIKSLPLAEKENALLSAFGTLSLYQLAGQIPKSLGASIKEAPVLPEESSFCSASSVDYLKQILKENKDDWLLPEWLDLCKASKQVVPADILPELLEEGRKQSELREKIIPVVGTRGRYLAKKNSDWVYASTEEKVEPAQAEKLWQTEGKGARQALLRALRTTYPSVARELVKSTWAEDAPEERAKFIETFSSMLSMEDEPFLEQALDDKRKEVRVIAQKLLAQLPESGLVKRMIERLTPLLNFTGKKMEVVLPTECDKSMIRDGIEAKVPSYLDKKLGEKGYWLQQMLSLVSPAYWAAKWSLEPKELLVLVSKTDWKTMFFEAFLSALEKQKPFSSGTWPLELLHVLPNEENRIYPLITQEEIEELLFQKVMVEPKSDITNKEIDAISDIVDDFNFTRILPVKVAQKLLDWLKKVTSQIKSDKNQRYWKVSYIFNNLSGIIPVSLLEEAKQGWAFQKEHYSYKSEVDEFLQELEQRAQMQATFQVVS